MHTQYTCYNSYWCFEIFVHKNIIIYWRFTVVSKHDGSVCPSPISMPSHREVSPFIVKMQCFSATWPTAHINGTPRTNLWLTGWVPLDKYKINRVHSSITSCYLWISTLAVNYITGAKVMIPWNALLLMPQTKIRRTNTCWYLVRLCALWVPFCIMVSYKPFFSYCLTSNSQP